MQRKVKYAALLILIFFPFIVWAAQKTMTTYMWDSNIQVQPSNLHIIDFEKDIADMKPGPSTLGAMTINTVNKTANLGNGVNDSCGVLWYGGTNALVAKCIDGKCDFGCGFRAYFDFRFLSTDTSATSTTLGDGFTFAIVNAANNSINTRGGPGSGSMGELMCYAGSGGSGSTAYGLRSPKMAIEFDTYGNTGAMTADGCSGNRADESNALNHMGLMFWGDNKTGNCSAGCTTCLKASYDDNIHGQCVSSCTNPGPVNSTTGDGTGGYCQRTGGKVGSYNWMEDGQTHRVRIEVTRATTPSGSTYPYNIKAWVDCEGACCSGSTCTACPAGELTAFQNIISAYSNASYPPKINRTVQLGTTDHTNFEKMIFGWTEGTGGATQSIEISNFKIYFPCSTSCYNYSINPTSILLGAAASVGNTVAVTTDTGCPWTAVSNDSWITITAGESGTGSGTITYDVALNDTGLPRTGTITIAGKIFTVNQATPPTCTLVANPIIVAYNSTTNLTWTIANGPANGTWTGTPGGTCGAFSNSTGGSCTTSARTTPRANTFTLNVSNAEGSSSCSATIYVGCQNYRVWNRLGGTRDFRVDGVCRQIGNNNEITQAADRLNPGATITAYSSAGTCATPLGIELDYNDAMNADIEINGGDADCQVNFTGNHTATDR